MRGNTTTRAFSVLATLLFCVVAPNGISQAKQNAAARTGASDTAQERIHRFESNVASFPAGEGQAAVQLDLPTLMQQFRIPGLSIAVIDNFQIVWAKAYGVVELGSTTPVTTETMFQAASISKAVTALGTLHLVEQGKLSLDEDVNKELVSWKVPENEFTREQKVTLRRIMSHSAGTTVHGFPGYATDAPIPTLVQILNGDKPANTMPVVVDVVPGTLFRYSGGGVTIEQQLVMDVTGVPFPRFMRETVLDKIGMDHSTYEQPLPPAKTQFAATGTNQNGVAVAGKWHLYPEMAAAGLWTTPTDLAKCAIEVALSKHGKANRVLSEKMTREMLTPQIEHMGLGFFLDKDNPDAFLHTGGNEGFESELLMLADSGQGVAIMANSQTLYLVEDYLIESVAREYRWKYVPPKHPAETVLMVLANEKDPKTVIRGYQSLRENHASEYDFSENDLNGYGYTLLHAKKIDDALEVFKLNAKEYPQSWNVYDSLAECYMNAGQISLAIQNYQKSVELNPKNTNGLEMLKKLKGQN